jgi:hypothetical protein
MARTFHVTGVPNLTTSVFTSATPSGAVSKAFNMVCGKKKACKEVLTAMDNKTEKKFTYVCTRKYKPVTVMVGGKEVTFKYETTVKSLKPGNVASVRKSISKKKSISKCETKCNK